MTDTALQPFAETDATVEPAEAEVSPTPPAPAEPVTPATASGRVVTASAPMVSDYTSFVYALGRIEPRFPSLSVEKEVAQVVARMDTAGYNDRQTMRAVLTDRENRYLVRNLCWVFLIEGLETYLLVPRDSADFDLLIDSYREDAGADDLDVVIGVRGPVASPDMCNGLAVPIVAFDQIYSFDRDSLIQSIPRPEGVPKSRDAAFRTTARDLLNQYAQLADNAGATDEHRALNYLAVRYPAIYAAAADARLGPDRRGRRRGEARHVHRLDSCRVCRRGNR